MPHKQKHRGSQTIDASLFALEEKPKLQKSAIDYNYLLTKNYSSKSALKLVGDHYQLHERQRLALQRCVDNSNTVVLRISKCINEIACNNQILEIDAYNILITMECGLSGAFIFKGMDGCIKDISGIHGTYHKVIETPEAIDIIAQSLEKLKIQKSIWRIDAPVSNSGRLKQLLIVKGEAHKQNWEIIIEKNPDASLSQSKNIVISSDSIILNQCERWFNLMDYILQTLCQPTHFIDFVNKIHF